MSQLLAKPLGKTQGPVENLRTKRRESTRKVLARVPVWVLIGLLLIVVIYPLLWMLLSSFKTSVEFSTGAFWSLPAGLVWQNYVQAWNGAWALTS